MLRCPRDIFSYCNEILHLTLEYLSYDPNFTDNMEEDTDDETHEEEEEEYVFAVCVFCWLLHLSVTDFVSYHCLFCVAVRVQMNIQMMKISVGKFEEQLLNAWLP